MYKKRGQESIGISFGMIFAIFMIVVFVVVAFIAIKAFLDIGRTTDVGLFYDDLQEAVDSAWRGQSSEAHFEVNLPKGIKKICFGNLTAPITGSQENYLEIRDFEVYDANLFLIPAGEAEGIAWKLINHLDIDRITENSNPYCVNADDGFTIKKGFYDKLVCIGECLSNEKINDNEEEDSINVNAEKNICQKAENENTCSWLDLGFEEGYEDKCCSEYNLCC